MRSAALCASSAERLFLIEQSRSVCGRSKRYFHGRGRNGKRHLQRRFLRKRGAAGQQACPLSLAALASSPKGGALGMAGKFPVELQSLRARSLPLGGAVAQRLRGFESAEPEKTVKRSSRRTGVNLQFFPVGAHFFRIVKGEQPLATGCGTQHPLRALGGTRVLLAAAPTTAPCFRRWRRSQLLHCGVGGVQR